jgi:L-aminopeptidase/D-esterase-like protein
MKEISISEIEGFSACSLSDKIFKTGLTVILTPEGAVASVHTPGFAPGSRETEALRPSSLVEKIHGLLLAGGSALGLNAVQGVTDYFIESGVGLKINDLVIPVVPAAVIFDFPFNTSKGLQPGDELGYEACLKASSDPIKSGPYGAGVSARSGKLGDPRLSSPSGLGSYGIVLPSGLKIAALAVVNPFGSVVDPETGKIISGVRRKDGTLLDREGIMELLSRLGEAGKEPIPQNTVLVAVGTNALIDKRDAYRLARMAGAGIARTIYPAHLLYDGDTVFAMSSGTGPKVDICYLGALAAEITAKAIVRSVPGQASPGGGR